MRRRGRNYSLNWTSYEKQQKSMLRKRISSTSWAASLWVILTTKKRKLSETS